MLAIGVRQDRVATLTWYLISAAQDDDAATAAATLKKQVSGGDAGTAQAAAKALTTAPLKPVSPSA